MDIVFLLSHIPNPRMNKRIDVAKKIGNTALISLDRKSYHIWEVQHKDIKNIIIPMPISTNPLKRVFQISLFAIKALRHLNKFKPKLIYVGNLDMLLIAYIYSLRSNVKIIYEVGDLNKLIIDEPKKTSLKLLRKLLIFIESKLCKRINYLVVTSEKFYEMYYSKFIPESKLVFMPNIPDFKAFENYSPKKEGAFTVGFIGGIRYIKQLKMLVDVAGKLNINVLIAGAGFNKNEEKELREYCYGRDYVIFTGRYDYMTDVANLYQQCDCIYSVYDADLNNVKIALPNKLYESIYCNLPIIVSKGTYLAELVEKMGVGVAVNHRNSMELEDGLKKMIVDSNYYNSLVEATYKYKEDLDIKKYNKKLTDRIQKLIV